MKCNKSRICRATVYWDCAYVVLRIERFNVFVACVGIVCGRIIFILYIQCILSFPGGVRGCVCVCSQSRLHIVPAWLLGWVVAAVTGRVHSKTDNFENAYLPLCLGLHPSAGIFSNPLNKDNTASYAVDNQKYMQAQIPGRLLCDINSVFLVFTSLWQKFK